MARRKAKREQWLTRPIRFMMRFDSAEIRKFRSMAKLAKLSMVEFARHKIFDLPTSTDPKADESQGDGKADSTLAEASTA